jgi:hypothetical protein
MKFNRFTYFIAAIVGISFAVNSFGQSREDDLQKVFARIGLVPKTQRILRDRGEVAFAIPNGKNLNLYYRKFKSRQESQLEFTQMKSDFTIVTLNPPINVGEMIAWSKHGRKWTILIQSGNYVFSLNGTDGESFEKGKNLAEALSEFFAAEKYSLPFR